MGSRLGAALSLIGLLVLGASALLVAESTVFAEPEAGLAGLVLVAVVLLLAAALWVLGNLLELAGFLATRDHGSRVVGVAGILAGLLHLAVLYMLGSITTTYNRETLAVLGVTLVLGIGYIVAGATWIRRAMR